MSPLVVAEICHLFKRSPHQPQPEIAFLRLLAGGRVVSLAPTADDYDRMADLVGQYASLPLGAADASVVAIAERLGVTRIATSSSTPRPGSLRSATAHLDELFAGRDNRVRRRGRIVRTRGRPCRCAGGRAGGEVLVTRGLNQPPVSSV